MRKQTDNDATVYSTVAKVGVLMVKRVEQIVKKGAVGPLVGVRFPSLPAHGQRKICLSKYKGEQTTHSIRPSTMLAVEEDTHTHTCTNDSSTLLLLCYAT